MFCVGDTGARGVTGNDGASIVGPPGRDGVNGTSIVGPRGITGATGADSTVVGPRGFNGSDGVSIVGATGAKGDPGRDGLNSTVVGPMGASIIGPAGKDGINGTSIVGPKGDKGDVGANSTVPGPAFHYESKLYVDPLAGNDLTCDGSFSSPCKTVAYILLITTPSPSYVIDITLFPGTYFENFTPLNLRSGFSYTCGAAPYHCIFPLPVRYFANPYDTGILSLTGIYFVQLDMDLTSNTYPFITPIFVVCATNTLHGISGNLNVSAPPFTFQGGIITSADQTTISTVRMQTTGVRITGISFGHGSVISMYGGSLAGNVTLYGDSQLTIVGVNSNGTTLHCVEVALDIPIIQTDAVSWSTLQSVDGPYNRSLLENARDILYTPNNYTNWNNDIPSVISQAIDTLAFELFALVHALSSIQLTPGPVGATGGIGTQGVTGAIGEFNNNNTHT